MEKIIYTNIEREGFKEQFYVAKTGEASAQALHAGEISS